MENKKDKLENFKTAISSTVRSLTNSQKLEVSFGNQQSKTEQDSIRLPDLQQNNNKLNYEEIRAIADSKSLNYRFSDKKIYKQFEPEGNISKKLYNISEKIRCEKIGTSYFKGVKNNIEKFYNKRISELDLKNSEDKIIESFENYLRIKFLDFENENRIDKKLKTYKKDLNDKFKNKISELKECTLDQEKFNSLISKLISDMSLDEIIDEEEKKDEKNDENESQSKPQNQDQKAKENDEKYEEMSIDSGVPDLENEAKDSDQTEQELEIEDNSRPDLKKRGNTNFGDLKYKSYTEEFDEVIKAEEGDWKALMSYTPHYMPEIPQSLFYATSKDGLDWDLIEERITPKGYTYFDPTGIPIDEKNYLIVGSAAPNVMGDREHLLFTAMLVLP